MNENRRIHLLVLFAFMLMYLAHSAFGDSILSIRVNGPARIQKIRANEHETSIRSGIESQAVESLNYRNFTILLNAVSNNSYEVQVYRVVNYGTHHVSSVYSSIYKSSVEYGYGLDKDGQHIVQYHFLFPPNSLTGWANPQDVAGMLEFNWGEKFPARNCSIQTPIHTLEESGREYLEAACMPDRDTALRFARHFVDYMLGDRGL